MWDPLIRPKYPQKYTNTNFWWKTKQQTFVNGSARACKTRCESTTCRTLLIIREWSVVERLHGSYIYTTVVNKMGDVGLCHEAGPSRPTRCSYHGTSLEPSRRWVIEKFLTKKGRVLSRTSIPCVAPYHIYEVYTAERTHTRFWRQTTNSSST